ncbi:MAG: class I SAM-dependent methyltransferase [Coriobacteriales bacterium]
MSAYDETSPKGALPAGAGVESMPLAAAPLLSEELLEAAQRAAQAAGLALEQRPQGLTLVGAGMELRGDFAQLLPRLRQDRLSKELLVRAARIKGEQQPLRAVDATAGMGEDALLLAAAGYEVLLIERDPVIAALLADCLRRAQADERLAAVAGRMSLELGESTLLLQQLPHPPQLVYLDPMFPAKGKAALTKKKLQLFQMLEPPCAQEEELLRAALAAAQRKVVVKRPLKAPVLAGVRPSSSLQGKTIRYDCIVPVR